MVVISTSLNLFLTPIYTVGIPYIEKIIFQISDELYGISEGIIGLGMVTGALLVTFISKKIPFSKFYYYFYPLIFLVILMGTTTLSIFQSKNGNWFISFCIFTFAGFLFAACLANINITFMTLLQLETPVGIMGKIMAFVSSLSMAFMPIGQIIFGFLYEYFSTSLFAIYIFVSGITLAVTIIIYRLIKSSHFSTLKSAQTIL